MHLDQPIGWLFFFVALVGVWAVVRSLKKRQMFPLVFAGLTVVLFGWFGIAKKRGASSISLFCYFIKRVDLLERRPTLSIILLILKFEGNVASRHR